MLTKIIIMNSIITTTMNHPISMGTMLMIQTIMVANKMSKESEFSWFAYILFITIIGGMMIMFMYMSSIASNEKFKISNKQMIIIMLTILIMLMIKESSMESLEKILENKNSMIQKEEMKLTTKFFNKNKMNITIMMMTILLMTMIIVTNISSTFEGPLKKTYV